MQGSNLTGANLSSAKGLIARDLAGANLTGAVLPDNINKFHISDSVALTASHARKLFAPLLFATLGVAYLAFSPSSDAAGYQVPFLNVKVSETIFAACVPLVILAWHFFFLLYMGRLWQGLGTLPAVFPEGVPLTHHPDSWFPILIIRLYLKRLGGWGGKLQGTGAAFLVWGMVPTLMFFTACGFLRLNSLTVNVVAAVTFMLSLVFSLHGVRKANLELTYYYRENVQDLRRRSVWRLGLYFAGAQLALVFGWSWWLKLLALVRGWIMS